ncbi:retrotransposon protein, putative, ty1-copia subclass [Tanacetum coccineum]
MVQEASGSHGLLEMSRSDKGLEIIQEEDTQPSENTSKEHNEVAPIEVEPQNVGVPIRRSARIPQAPDRYGYYINVEEYELGDLDEPPNYKAALADPESDKWLEAMNTKMQSMKDNQVWILVELPPNGRTVRSKWLFKKKTDMDGNVYTFKARLVAKGYTQTYDVDYGETFSPVADIRAIRILLAIAAFYDYEIWQIDVKTAFLNGHLSGDVYMVQLEGFVDPKYPNKVCKLQRSIYGLKFNYDAVRSSRQDAVATPYAQKIVVRFQTDRDDTKSQTRYVFVLNGGVVDWKSAKQSTTSMSSIESEYIDGLGGVMPSNKRPMEMLCDNEPALAIASDLRILKGARHFQRKYHYIREVIQEGEIIFKKVHTDNNVADPFTKPMSFNKHFEHAMAIGIVPASSLM